MTIIVDPPTAAAPLVARPRLLARLDAGTAPLTVLSAPAGWGKTTLLNSWTRAPNGPVVRVPPGRPEDFWRRATAAVSSAARCRIPASEGQAGLVALLHASGPLLSIVVDDCIEAADPAALAALAETVRAVGGHRLLVACRGQPAFALHRWGMAGHLDILTEDELAFSLDETAALFASHEVNVSGHVVADLHAQAEGWPAALRLTALALRGRHQPAPAADLVDDFLRTELLDALSPGVHRMLVETSVSGTLTADLIRSLTGRTDGAAVLFELYRQGSFLRRCTGPGDTYRLHPMLGRLLYQELGARDRDRLADAHRRAADWFLVQGPPAEALRHLLAAHDWQRAGEVLGLHWPDILVAARRAAPYPVVTGVPVPAGPRVLLAMAAERVDAGDPAGAQRLLTAAGPGAQRPIRTALEIVIARTAGRLGQVREIAADAMTDQPPDPRLQPLALLALGAEDLHRGRWRAAERHLREALRRAQLSGLDHIAASAGSHLAAWLARFGRLAEAVRASDEAGELADRLGLTGSADLCWSHLAMAETALQRQHPGAAWSRATLALEGARGDRLAECASIIAQARIRTSAGHLAEAHDLLDLARLASVEGELPAAWSRALALAAAELRLASGDPGGTRELLTVPEDPYPDQTAVVEGRVFLAQGRPAAAAGAVAPLLGAADPAVSLTCRVSAGLIAALAGVQLGRRDQAERGLRVALTISGQQGHRRDFVAGGAQVRALIASVAPSMQACPEVAAALIEPTVEVPRSGVEPLTVRELTVLRYLQGTLSHAEIAEQLHISANTVKTHVKNLYRKLPAASRRQAVHRARELHLL
jgi:LuxR family maltose regulon positive regulatory protein